MNPDFPVCGTGESSEKREKIGSNIPTGDNSCNTTGGGFFGLETSTKLQRSVGAGVFAGYAMGVFFDFCALSGGSNHGCFSR